MRETINFVQECHFYFNHSQIARSELHAAIYEKNKLFYGIKIIDNYIFTFHPNGRDHYAILHASIYNFIQTIRFFIDFHKLHFKRSYNYDYTCATRELRLTSL